MSQDWYNDVLEFHEKFDCKIGVKPHIPDDGLLEFRKALIEEEIKETFAALENNDIEGFADGLADCIYVIVGFAITAGIDLRPVWDKVQRANMAKTGGGKRDDGKVLKPEGWQPPQILPILQKQGYEEGVQSIP